MSIYMSRAELEEISEGLITAYANKFSHFSRYAVISVFQNSENSGYEYQVAPDMAMTVRMIMILLYGAGGVPGRG